MTALRSQFLTTRAAARHMTAHGSGVIVAFGGGGPQTLPGFGGFKVALDALKGLRRQWAIEPGPHGIRVVTLKSGGPVWSRRHSSGVARPSRTSAMWPPSSPPTGPARSPRRT
ncbi:SDR family oxidoreductase [Streptomyces sp. NPDC049627]|uniref:SDR family oxidoreductase n=1 Tax=Streptomyces sp. NPDC049627 TaxID=3365595 RepID=UPI0037B04DFD